MPYYFNQYYSPSIKFTKIFWEGLGVKNEYFKERDRKRIIKHKYIILKNINLIITRYRARFRTNGFDKIKFISPIEIDFNSLGELYYEISGDKEINKFINKYSTRLDDYFWRAKSIRLFKIYLIAYINRNSYKRIRKTQINE
jgi:hypothetical protein